MPHTGNSRRRDSDHFFTREADGSVRIRLRFTGEEASMMEEAAGETPVMDWLQETLHTAARQKVVVERQRIRELRPPS